MDVTILIPDELAEALAGPRQDLAARIQLDLAVQYYQQGLVSVGYAAEMSGLQRGQFEQVLGQRNIVRNYSEEDLEDALEEPAADTSVSYA